MPFSGLSPPQWWHCPASTVEVWQQVTSFGLWICAQTAWSRQSQSSDMRWKGSCTDWFPKEVQILLNSSPPWSASIVVHSVNHSPAEVEGRPISVSSRQVRSGRWVLGQPIYIVAPPTSTPTHSLPPSKKRLVWFCFYGMYYYKIF